MAGIIGQSYLNHGNYTVLCRFTREMYDWYTLKISKMQQKYSKNVCFPLPSHSHITYDKFTDVPLYLEWSAANNFPT